MGKYYLSTAIPYVNSPPHAGFALEIVQADVIARYHRILGEDVFFLTGTDENSLKNVRAAREEGIPVKKFVDRNAQKFYELKKILNLSFDDFIRTTEKRHIKGAQKLWLACKKDIYKKKYRGLYCIDCEEFYKENELENGFCPEHKTKPELVEEENYFFKLSKYQNQLKKIIEKDEVKIIPLTRKNEVLSFINQGLEDICISRLAQRAGGWGIPVPGDPSQIQWCWFDALSNYISALGYGENSKKFQEWWQKNENKLHIIGKGILRFHGIYLIAMLLSAKLALPKTIFVHGYLTVGGQKMSKSLGNIIDPFELVKKYGSDSVRYFLLAEFPATEDGDFTYEKFEARYNADLANGIGNLFERILTMAISYGYKHNDDNNYDTDIKNLQEKTEAIYTEKMNNYQLYEALVAVFSFAKKLDQYINAHEPWRLMKNKNPEADKILATLIFGVKNIISWLKPFIPSKMEQAERYIKNLSSQKEKLNLFPRL